MSGKCILRYRVAKKVNFADIVELDSVFFQSLEKIYGESDNSEIGKSSWAV